MEKLEKNKSGHETTDLPEKKRDKLIAPEEVSPSLEFVYDLERLIKHGLAEQIVEKSVEGDVLRFEIKTKDTDDKAGEILFFEDIEGLKKLSEKMKKIINKRGN